MIDRILDWLGEHPWVAILLFLLLFFGGCSISIHVGIISHNTKLMPY